jgi:hypothetical protein
MGIDVDENKGPLARPRLMFFLRGASMDFSLELVWRESVVQRRWHPVEGMMSEHNSVLEFCHRLMKLS